MGRQKENEEDRLKSALSLAGYRRTALTLRGHRVIVAARLLVETEPGGAAEKSARKLLEQSVRELETLENALEERQIGRASCRERV